MTFLQSERPSVSRLAGAWPVLGWLGFYSLLVLAWLGLVQLGPVVETQGSALDLLLARCLAPSSASDFGPLVLMWALMAQGMMLPTSIPTLGRLAILVQQGSEGRASLRFLAFLLAYAAVWLGFALVAALLHFALARLVAVAAWPFLSVIVLAGAGLYQFSRLKAACLTRCRHPMTFFMAHWQSGLGGAFRMGLRHGLDCLGCCWALMLLSLIGGAMTLAWMGGGMILMMLEKLAGTGRFVTIPLGLILVAASGYALGNIVFAI
jgi:predicted metal-binding membrane protein